MVIDLIVNAEEYLLKTVEDSTKRRNYDFSTESKAYLVKMLSEYIRQPQPDNTSDLNNTLAFSAQAILDERRLKNLRLQQLGNSCLMTVGLFYDFLNNRSQSYANYYCDIGSTAYSSLSSSLKVMKTDLSNLFSELADHFRDFGLVIGDLNYQGLPKDRKLFIFLEKWLQTKGERYAQLLKEEGIKLPSPKDKVS